MLAKMCILEKIPQAFDAYVPPRGINIAWYSDFKGKANDNQVVAFFTGIELSTNEDDIVKAGDIKKEIQNNRCFTVVKTIPREDWDKVIEGFNFGAEIVSMPKDHPNINPDWQPVREYEGEIDEDAFENLNKLSMKKSGARIDTDPSKVKLLRNKDRGQNKKVKVPYVSFIDAIREDKD